MRKLILPIIFMMLKITSINAQLPTQDSAYQLIFSDEFNGTTLDTSKWESQYRWGWINYKTSCGAALDTSYLSQFYTPPNHNHTFDGNAITLQGRKEAYIANYIHHYTKVDSCTTCPSPGVCKDNICTTPIIYKDTFEHTVGGLFSKKKFKYGYFEIRVKLPDVPVAPANHKGISTSFWLFNGDQNVSWSELDFYEIKATNNHLTNNVHYRKKGGPPKVNSGYEHAPSLIFNNAYKTIGANWSPEKIDFYLDGVLLRTTTFLNKCDSLISMPIFLTTKIDLTQFCERIDSNTVLPYDITIDYIKVYQRKVACDSAKIYCNDLSTHDYKTYESITLDGSGCTDTLNNKANESFTASNYILFNEGFELGTNITSTFEILKCFIGQDFSNKRIGPLPPFEEAPDGWYERENH